MAFLASLVALAVVASYLALPAATGDDQSEAALNNPIRILLVGDSITSGRTGFPNEAPTYRADLWDKLNPSFNVDFVGSETGIDNFPNVSQIAALTNRNPNHEGHNGWRLDEMINGNAGNPSEGKMADWIATEDPDIIVIYGGANDFAQGEEASQVYSDFLDAIAAMRAAKPDIRILITNNHPHENNAIRNAKIDTLNPFIPMLEQLSTPTSPIVTVDIHTGYPSSGLDNGSHPGPNGQSFFAEQIYRGLLNGGLLLDDSPAPSLNNTNRNGNRGVRGREITLTGQNIFAGFTADLGDGVTVTDAKWNNNPASSSSITLTLDIDLWASPGTRDIVVTNKDGDTATCSNCFTVNQAQDQPPLKIMMLGGETLSGRRWVPAEEPTFRGPLWDLINADGVSFDFVGTQSGVDSFDRQSLPLAGIGDPDHEGHREWHINELLNGKAGQESEGNLGEWLDEHNPDVVVLMAGQQDVRTGQSDFGVMAELKQAVEVIRAHNPNIRIVVTNLNRHKSSASINADIDSFNAYFAANSGSNFNDVGGSVIATANISTAAINSSTYPNATGNTTIATAVYNALVSRSMLDPADQPPGPPSNVSINGDLGQITVDWSAAQQSGYEGTPLTGYKVTLTPGGQTVTVGASTTEATFVGLSSQVNYTATVYAQNATGDGPGVSAQGSPTASYDTNGYWMLRRTGKVHAFGGAQHHGDPEGTLGGATAVAIAGHPNGGGYWVLASNGTVYAYGSAQIYAPATSTALNPGESVTTIAAHPSGTGYWVFTTAGRVIAYGNAGFFQDLISLGVVPNGPVIASAPTASGNGYYMVGSEGGVFAFGDAVFSGSIQSVITDDLGLNIAALDWLASPIVGVVPTPDGTGYWMIAADGGVFGFNAPFLGSVPGALNGGAAAFPINGLVPFGTAGYIAVGDDGGIFAFGDAIFYGSLPQIVVATDVVGVAPSLGLSS